MRGVVITGTSRGLGAELFRLLAGEVVRLVPIDRYARAPLSSANAEIHHLEQDLSALAEADRWETLTEGLRARLDGRPSIDGLIFVNNAGTVHPIGGPDECTPAELTGAVAVNLTAPLAIVRAMLDIARPQAVPVHVVNITSGASLRPIGGWAAYCATKAGIRMALDSAQRTYPDRLTVAHVDPGVLDGSMQDAIRRADRTFPDRDMFVRWKAEGRLRTPSQAAHEIFSDHIAGRL